MERSDESALNWRALLFLAGSNRWLRGESCSEVARFNSDYKPHRKGPPGRNRCPSKLTYSGMAVSPPKGSCVAFGVLYKSIEHSSCSGKVGPNTDAST